MSLYWNRKTRIYQQMGSSEYESIKAMSRKIGLRCSLEELKGPQGIFDFVSFVLNENREVQ